MCVSSPYPLKLAKVNSKRSISKIPSKRALVAGKRRVRFASEITSSSRTNPAAADVSPRPQTEMTGAEKQSAFWTKGEFKTIRLAAKFNTKRIRSQARKEIAHLDEAFLTALRLCTMNDEQLHQVLENPDNHIMHAEAWCCSDTGGRGLERYVSAMHRLKRDEYAKDSRVAVLRMHQSDKISAGQLSAFYIEYAKSATVYARLMAQADAIWARNKSVVQQESEMATPAVVVSTQRVEQLVPLFVLSA